MIPYKKIILFGWFLFEIAFWEPGSLNTPGEKLLNIIVSNVQFLKFLKFLPNYLNPVLCLILYKLSIKGIVELVRSKVFAFIPTDTVRWFNRNRTGIGYAAIIVIITLIITWIIFAKINSVLDNINLTELFYFIYFNKVLWIFIFLMLITKKLIQEFGNEITK